MILANHLQFEQLEAREMVIENRTGADGTGVEGQIMYRADTDVLKYHDGSTWITLASSSSAVNSVTAGDGLSDSGTATDPILDVNVDDSTIEINADTLRVKALGITASQLASNAVTTAKILDSNVTLAKLQDISSMTVIGRTAGGSGVASEVSILDEDDLVSNSDTALATQQSIKTYIDNTVANLGSIQGGYDASVETTFPASSTAGDYWYVTAAGTIQGINFDVGDMIISNVDNAGTTTPSDWTFLETNREQATTSTLGLVELATGGEAAALTDTDKAITPGALASVTASTTAIGLVELATQAEVDTGTDTTRAVTPDTLAGAFSGKIFSSNVGNGAATSIAVSHNLGSEDVLVALYNNSTGAQEIPDVTVDTINQITLDFANAPTSNEYKVVIMTL